jgi:ADP-ribosylglycohydrolase
MLERDKFEDKVRGVVFGHAIGDAIGLGTEFLSKKMVREYYPSGLEDLHQIKRDGHRIRWEQGDWTDDTDQMLCILDSLLQQRTLDVHNIASRIFQWAYDGGMGIGLTVENVVFSDDFLAQPHTVSERVWLASGKRGAANGGVMRTSILGVWQYSSTDDVIRNAEAVCRITHFDPRCVASCVVICLAIRSLLTEEHSEGKLCEKLVPYLLEIADRYDPRVKEYITKGAQPAIESLELDDPESIGYTLKAMASGIWALLYPSSYREGILEVIHEGGDADTNAAVAGSILGARFGFSGIPTAWVEGLRYRRELEIRVELLLEMLTIH